jgi:DNA-binding CsgD family transcriptional regulator
MKHFRYIFLLLTLISTSSSIAGNNKNLDSLLIVLDKTITERTLYNKNKIDYLNSLKAQLYQATGNQQKFNILGQLFEGYKNFQLDSAFQIATKRIEIANIIQDKKEITMANMNFAEVMMATGMYKESLDIIKSRKPSYFDKESKAYYFHLCHSLSILMSDYSILENERIYYKEQEYQYKDSILSVLEKDEIGYYLVNSSQLIYDGKYDEALEIAKESYGIFNKNGHDIALTAYSLSEVYKYKGEKEEEKYYLALSSINDMRAGVKEYIALRNLAILLYEAGDIDRAYSYIKCSMEDAIFCNARLRTLELSQMLPIINDTYDLKMRKERDNLISSLVVISVLSVILLLAIIYIYKQLKALARTRRYLKETNKDLQKMIEQINNVNLELSESNLVKEEYLGYVFNICSAYIDKLDDFRKKVNRKLQAGQGEDLYKMTNSSSFVSDELKEFYRNFDSIFLNIYPDFISDFNALLADDAQVHPREGELLSTELRIYALVRLGINDSVKIAGFLHYSPQTVYNYRLKIRNKAKISKDNFSEAVRQIGRIKK